MKKPKKTVIVPEYFRTYLAFIRNGVGSRMFRTDYCRVNGRVTDVTDGGRVSCGLHVSATLKMFDLIKGLHVTVGGTLRDMQANGWQRIARPRVGAVVLWEPLDHGGSINSHIGFLVAPKTAVSNSSALREIAEHDWTYGREGGKPKRKIEAIYWHPRLGK
jgi:hypothetical protein